MAESVIWTAAARYSATPLFVSDQNQSSDKSGVSEYLAAAVQINGVFTGRSRINNIETSP